MTLALMVAIWNVLTALNLMIDLCSLYSNLTIKRFLVVYPCLKMGLSLIIISVKVALIPAVLICLMFTKRQIPCWEEKS